MNPNSPDGWAHLLKAHNPEIERKRRRQRKRNPKWSTVDTKKMEEEEILTSSHNLPIVNSGQSSNPIYLSLLYIAGE